MLSLRSHYYAGSPPTREMSSSSKLPVFSSNNHISDHTGNCLTSFHHVKLEESSNVLHQILESNGCWKVQAKIGAGLGSAPRGLESTPTIPTSVTFQNLMKYVSSISNRCTELDLHSMYDFPQSTSNTIWNRQPRHKTTAHARAQITCVESHHPVLPSVKSGIPIRETRPLSLRKSTTATQEPQHQSIAPDYSARNTTAQAKS
jgi:hypothetical protein